MTTLLVPCDPLTPTRPDEHFAPEADAAKRAGWNVVLVDHDAILHGGGTLFRRQTFEPGAAIYRGWMIPTNHYAGLWLAMSERGVRMETAVLDYERAHELPRWYWSFCNLTPNSVWTEGGQIERFTHLCQTFGIGSVVLRDYVKSEKHYWDEACFIESVADVDSAARVASRFRELRGDAFTGGYVLRRYESFVGPEARLWCRHGEVRLITAHPDSPDVVTTPLRDFVVAVERALADANLDFVSVDVTERADGQWRVVEVGDGQVSDRPSSCDPYDFITAIS